jgi:tetratricopeptide (TPR) repeat protein/predicted aspartyl protease
MKIRSFHVAFVIFGLSVPAARASAECKIHRLAELPVTMAGLRPLVPAKINGSDVLFIADSGAFYSMITPGTAAEQKLKRSPAPFELTVRGVGGNADVSVTTVKTFTLANVPLSNVEFLVGGNELGDGAAGVLGQNVLRIADVEYDLANGAIRLMRPESCGKSELAYWAASQPYSVMDIGYASVLSPHTTGTASINGEKIRVMFDTGSAASVLSLRAAERAGVKPGAAGVVAAGFWSGVGRRTIQTWIAPFSNFKIGDEEIRNTHLRIGDVEFDNADMLIGADFFLSHHIYVASSQHKLYFTYNGGPVFNLTTSRQIQTRANPEPEDPAKTEKVDEEPTDAATFSRRGTAFAARRDFERAIADLTRACELDPSEPKYFYERGVALLNNKQPYLAMADFDQALKLNPDDVSALVARAELRVIGRDNAQAKADLDAADQFAPKEADVRFFIGALYARAGMFALAVAQYDLWIAAHSQDVRMAEAMNGRCWARALWGQDLAKALSDCNTALKLTPNSARALDSRGLVRLRMGDFDKSIADYDAALRLQPKIAWSLYGRGLDKLRRGMTTEGQTDIAAATALQPLIAEEARKHGIGP